MTFEHVMIKRPKNTYIFFKINNRIFKQKLAALSRKIYICNYLKYYLIIYIYFYLYNHIAVIFCLIIVQYKKEIYRYINRQ